jgi:hypothetical protein
MKLTNVTSRYITYPVMRPPRISWSQPESGHTYDFTTRTVELKPVGFDVKMTGRLEHWARLQAANIYSDDEVEVVRDIADNTAAIIIRKAEL